MPLETINYISDLNAANPAVSDGLVQGDDHLRGIKAALKNTFPNFTGAPLNSSQAQLDAISALLTVSHGQLRGPGLPRCGQFVDFPCLPATRFTSGGAAAGGQAAVDHIECDGSVYLVSDYPDLFAMFGALYGGNGTTTFAVPRLTDTGRFRRSRIPGVLVASSLQANQNAAHVHAVIGTADNGGVDHQHFVSTYSGFDTADHSHTYNRFTGTGQQGASGGTSWAGFFDAPQTGGASQFHQHLISDYTGTSTAYLHSHNINFNSQSSGGSEARPESFSQVVTVKT